MLKLNLSSYLLTIIIWQVAGLAIVLTKNEQTAYWLYRIFTLSTIGFLYAFLPLSLTIIDHKKTMIVTGVAVVLFLLSILVVSSRYFSFELYLGKGGFYIPISAKTMTYVSMPALIMFLIGALKTQVSLKAQSSALIRHRLYYFTAASVLVLGSLLTNLTPLKNYPVDLLLALSSGFIIHYAVFQKRVLNIRKVFKKVGLYAVLLVTSTGMFTLLIYLRSLISDSAVPYYTILPALMTLFVFFIFMTKYNNADISSKSSNIFFPGSSIYQLSLHNYKYKVLELHNFDSIFSSFHDTLSNDLPLSWLEIHHLDRSSGELLLVFSKDKKTNGSRAIQIGSQLISLLKSNEIVIIDELELDQSYNGIAAHLNDIYSELLPDIILPIKIASEVIVIISMKMSGKEEFFLDKEDQAYILKLNRYTTEAVTRSFAHEQLQQEVFNKENLIIDINHRVKNNLQMIAGLLSLQGFSTNNNDTKAALETAQQRIRTIAKIHEMLYIRDVMSTVNLKDYLDAVIAGFYPETSSGKEILFKINIPDIEVETEKALTICLIVNELVSNSVKYAFPERDSGIINISLNITADGYLLCVIMDDGIGYNPEITKSSGIGHSLVDNFIKKQLKGSWDITSGNGTKHKILIPMTT
ncbi:MAG: sensor histidine kinase [Spirochaetales bacterium]|nr:sensor histidine kinase [Spirochaetales bacterium]